MNSLDLHMLPSLFSILPESQLKELREIFVTSETDPSQFPMLAKPWLQKNIFKSQNSCKILKDQTNSLSEADMFLINNLVSKCHALDPIFLTHCDKNFTSLKLLLKEIDEIKCSKNLKFTVTIETTSTVIEMINKLIYQIIYPLLPPEKYNQEYYKRKGETPAIGKNLELLSKELHFLEAREQSVLNDARKLRNMIAHARIYFDVSRDDFVIIDNGDYETVSREEIFLIINKINDFLQQFIYVLIDSQNSIFSDNYNDVILKLDSLEIQGSNFNRETKRRISALMRDYIKRIDNINF